MRKEILFTELNKDNTVKQTKTFDDYKELVEYLKGRKTEVRYTILPVVVREV